MDRYHRQWVRASLALGVCVGLSLAAAGITAAQDEDLSRLRTLDHQLASLIRQGLHESPTFRRLVDAVQQSDLIVYVERHNRFRDGKSGSIQLVGTRGGQRYLRIALNSALNQRELIVLLAHELQHAGELASAPHVSDENGVRELYCSVGDARQFGYDTERARRVTNQVSAELAAHPDR